MLTFRKSGLLCHISSLPSPYGIGDLGPEAYAFVDFLSQSGQRCWQILPINPTDRALGNSPYSSYSAFGFNALLISPDLLCVDGFVTRADIQACYCAEIQDVDFESVTTARINLLAKAYQNYARRSVELKEFEHFKKSARLLAG